MDDSDPDLDELLKEPEVIQLVQARPHVFPPSINPPFHYKNGVPVSKRTDATIMTKAVWESYGCEVVHWRLIMVESTPQWSTQAQQKRLTFYPFHFHGHKRSLGPLFLKLHGLLENP